MYSIYKNKGKAGLSLINVTSNGCWETSYPVLLCSLSFVFLLQEGKHILTNGSIGIFHYLPFLLILEQSIFFETQGPSPNNPSL